MWKGLSRRLPGNVDRAARTPARPLLASGRVEAYVSRFESEPIRVTGYVVDTEGTLMRTDPTREEPKLDDSAPRPGPEPTGKPSSPADGRDAAEDRFVETLLGFVTDPHARVMILTTISPR